MSDEKRQTRLLPFRLGRAGRRAGARGPLDGAEDSSADPELTALLRAWEAPPQSDAATGRLLADFRAEFGRAPLWRRALAARVRVPAPVAACAAAALLLSLAAHGARRPTGPDAAGTAPAAAASEAQAAGVRVVEVPVYMERVVTRTVYVEKKERGAARGVSSRAAGREQMASAGAEAEARGAGAEARGASRDAAPERDGPAAAAAAQAAQGGYFTNVDMNDFQPADEVKIRIVKKGSVDEK
ncbi:MAG TPA: hypothetical protein VF668_24370 [Pyrinomonadaceae bacterium]|jgi:hypothetical protein